MFIFIIISIFISLFVSLSLTPCFVMRHLPSLIFSCVQSIERQRILQWSKQECAAVFRPPIHLNESEMCQLEFCCGFLLPIGSLSILHDRFAHPTHFFWQNLKILIFWGYFVRAASLWKISEAHVISFEESAWSRKSFFCSRVKGGPLNVLTFFNILVARACCDG